MANQFNAVLYCGVTDNLVQRVWTHKQKVDKTSFTAKYNINKLVYFEVYQDAITAISREKQLKGGSRKKKMELIKNDNPEFKDLYDEIAS